jgi:Cof subfamily protein (haloacid dehalogenase superfamily)
MQSRDYDALVLDLDGTLLDEQSAIPAANKLALARAQAHGVRVMVATGRSSISAHPLLEELALDGPSVVFNGAALYDPRSRRMLEERVLSQRTLERVLAWGRARRLMMVVMCADRKLATIPRDECERDALRGMTALEFVAPEELDAEFVIRVTLFSRDYAHCNELERALEAAVGQPVYLTSFPLSVLASHRDSPMHVVDVHPPCRGKAEALRLLSEHHAIPPERVVAVGDATNDIPMFQAAGLSVCMASGMEEALAAAQRVIGGNETSAIADLIEELFLSRPPRAPSRPAVSSTPREA